MRKLINPIKAIFYKVQLSVLNDQQVVYAWYSETKQLMKDRLYYKLRKMEIEKKIRLINRRLNTL